LQQLTSLNLYDPPVNLLVLSACQTAVGDREAELGFSGLAVRTGVKSALASLWSVSDEGTLVLMSNFYAYLREKPLKVGALRQAQLAMLSGETRWENGSLKVLDQQIPVSSGLAQLGERDLSHPYYWSGFTLVGSPW
jgi:CHAT domain-containing protein